MRHLNKGRKLGRTHSHRKALLKNLVTSLLEHERGTLHDRRLAARYVADKNVLATLFSDYAARFKDRPGGYTRIFKLGPRKGDAADMAIIELLPASGASAAAEGGAVTTKESFA